MSTNKEKTIDIDIDTGEMLNETAVALQSAKQINLKSNTDSFIHVRNDCSASGGMFKVGSNPIAKSMNATLIAVRAFKNVALFTRKGESAKYQDWAQVLFVDDKYGNLKSTIIKTRSIGSLISLIQSAMAVNESPVGMGFTMRFVDAEGENESGKFKYKFLEFERSDSESPYAALAAEIHDKLTSKEIKFPSFDNEI